MSRSDSAASGTSSSASHGRAHLEYARTLDAAAWQRTHAAGLVPDRFPYGLDHLAEQGLELTVRRPTTSRLLRGLDGAARKATGGFELVNLLADRDRRSCDVAVCWDERTGVPAGLHSRGKRQPPAAFGVIWLTEPGLQHARGARLAARALREAALVWVLAQPQLDILQRLWRVPASRLAFVPMGIDAEFWRSSRAAEPGLVVAAGNDRHRDHPLLVESLSRLHKRRPSTRLELVTREPVPVAAELGRRHPHLSHREMRNLYERSSVVAVALRHNVHVSGMSVLLEAMACGRPVVATATPGMDDYVTHEETGLLVPDEDPDAFAGAVESLLSDPAGASDMGRAGRRAIEARFTTAALAERLADQLHAALGSARPGS